ncbi:PucR family transcriptional regulator [Arthrobacter woluwensis]|uniref:PucR family transcriptional regulator n=1 Tax=Arthrobacter woluwensis TaxID=156980 RepID=UPI000D1379A1|nr:PucR family transcriptional regulator [Arthrobacter woluwensis]PSS46009.1 PucR family transcriptional regulator [Arthrobacter woluwensis]
MGQSAHSIHGAASAGEAQLDLLPGLTTHRFLAQLPEGVEVLHDAGNVPLRWVETSELADPTPYLLDHELLLTAGLPFLGDGGTDEAVDAFVGRLARARVSALAFGLEPHFDAVPGAVVAACERHGVTLWQLPSSLPFAAVGLAFSRLLESGNASVLRQLTEANRQLIRAALGEGGEQELLEALAQRVSGEVLLFGAHGQLRLTAGARTAGPEVLEEAAGLALDLFAGSGPRVELRETADGALLGLPLRGSPGRGTAARPAAGSRTAPSQRGARRGEPTLGALVLHTGHPLTATENTMVSTAVGLLELLARQRAAGSLSPGQLATLLLLRGDTRGDDAALSTLLGDSAPGAGSGLRVVIAHPQAEDSADVPAEVLAWRRLWETKLVVHDGTHLLAVTRQEPSPARLSRVEAEGYACAVSRPAPRLGKGGSLAGHALQHVPRLRLEAMALLARAEEERRSLLAEQQPRTFAELMPREAGAGVAREVLGPLLALEPPRRDLLLRVLRAWLAAHGSWDGASSALDIHRNSVRRHVGVIGDTLGRDLGDASVRAELWFALGFLGPELPGGAAADPSTPADPSAASDDAEPGAAQESQER